MTQGRPIGRLLRGAALLLALGLGLGLGIEVGQRLVPQAAPAPVIAIPEGVEAVEAATIAVFEARRDSVVSISTRAAVRDLFSRRLTEQPLGSGSGFFWDEAGHVVTNAHVIEGASAAVVTLADGRSFDARLVGRDPSHDLAVLRIDGRAQPPALPTGSSGDLQVGRRVLAIGNPFGLDWTLTTGIVSALDRDLVEGARTIRGLIQTDAAINPGNSGGPLLDADGRLVGVNTAIFSPSGANAGIGFAVPVDTVARVVPQLIETGTYAPPSLGLVFDAWINAAANRQGLEGALVLDVAPGIEGVRPATTTRDGRIVPGDLVVGVDGIEIRTLGDLSAALDARAVGETVTVTLRNGEGERTREMTLVEGR